jgi:hypothetical protein
VLHYDPRPCAAGSLAITTKAMNLIADRARGVVQVAGGFRTAWAALRCDVAMSMHLGSGGLVGVRHGTCDVLGLGSRRG